VKEIVISKDNSSGQQSYEFQRVNRSAMSRWFYDRNEKVTSAMPQWFEQGLEEYVMTAVNKNGKLDFRPDDWEAERLRETAKQGKVAKPRQMLLSGWEEFNQNAHPLAQAGALVRYLLQGQGAKGKTKDLLKSYLKNLVALVEEEDGNKGADGSMQEDAKTEEEEEQRFKDRQQKYKEKEKEFLQSLFDKTFVGWDDKDWRAFETAYTASVG
jgi:hypothetical protein